MHEPARFRNLVAVLLTSLLSTACSPRADQHDEHDGHDEHEAVPAPDEHDEREEGFVELSSEALSRIGVRTETVASRSLPAVLETTGQVDFDANRLTHVSPRISGRAHWVPAQLGDDVERGDRLAVLDSIELGRAKAAFLRAKAQHDLTKKNYEREKGLEVDRISSEREVLAAEALFLESAADYAAADQTLHLYGLDQNSINSLSYDDPKASLSNVRAPLSGRIVEKHITLGELVTPEQNIFTIADLSQVWIWIDVYERDLRQVHIDDDVELELDAYPSEVFQGKVSYLSDQVDADSRTVRARVDVPNPDGKLRPGSFAKVRVTDPHDGGAATSRPATLVVPREAVQRESGEKVIFVVAGDRRYERREVTLGRRASGFVEVLTGLTEGDEIVVKGAFLLKSEAAKESMGGGHSH